MHTNNTWSCPACKAAYPKHIEEAVVFGCPACGIAATSQAGGGLKIGPVKLAQRIHYYMPDWLQLGARLEWEGRDYTVFEVMSYRSNWNEWDSEDSKWESGVSDSLEWYAIADDGTELCIEYDDGKHFFRFAYDTPPMGLEHQLGDPVRAGWVEYGSFDLVAMEGEDDEPLDTQQYQYAVLSHTNGDVYVEWPNRDSSAKQYYAYQRVTPTMLKKMRISEDHVREAARAALPMLSFLRTVFGVAMLAVAVLLITSLGKGGKIMSNSATFDNANTSDSSGLAPRALGTFSVKKGQGYSLAAYCQFNEANVGGEFSLEIVKVPEGQRVNTVSCAFYTESGYDDEGAWTESTLSDSYYFTPEEDGTYEAILYPANLFREQSIGPISGVFTVRVGQLTLSRYYFIGFLLLFITWLVLQWRLENTRLLGDTEEDTWMHQLTDVFK